eukprot:scaffold1761_cov357-Prasinococcus_capsulatus_cf.AAC.3
MKPFASDSEVLKVRPSSSQDRDFGSDSVSVAVADANKFKEHFEKACEINAEAPSQPEAEEEEAPKTEAEKAADDLAKDVEEKAKVEEAT